MILTRDELCMIQQTLLLRESLVVNISPQDTRSDVQELDKMVVEIRKLRRKIISEIKAGDTVGWENEL